MPPAAPAVPASPRRYPLLRYPRLSAPLLECSALGPTLTPSRHGRAFRAAEGPAMAGSYGVVAALLWLLAGETPGGLAT